MISGIECRISINYIGNRIYYFIYKKYQNIIYRIYFYIYKKNINTSIFLIYFFSDEFSTSYHQLIL